jgi:predicted amino acid-binding ACT domain protein
MQKENYREVLSNTVNNLVNVRQVLFDGLFELAIAGELKEWNESVEVGESYTFTKEIFEGCTDANIQLIVKLMNKVESTCDSLCNLNNIDFPNQNNSK